MIEGTKKIIKQNKKNNKLKKNWISSTFLNCVRWERNQERDLRIGTTTDAIEVKVKAFICACNPLFQSDFKVREKANR